MNFSILHSAFSIQHSNKHLLQAGGFDLFELLELDAMFGNQLVEHSEVGADFSLLP